ncbi:hypothetical protein U1Q18_007597 [Sarracenia purpurea var. burkii]
MLEKSRISSRCLPGSESVKILLHNIMATDTYHSRMVLEMLSDDFQGSPEGNTECGTVTTANQDVFTRGMRLPSRISQLGGPIPDPYDDILSTPNNCHKKAFMFMLVTSPFYCYVRKVSYFVDA